MRSYSLAYTEESSERTGSRRNESISSSSARQEGQPQQPLMEKRKRRTIFISLHKSKDTSPTYPYTSHPSPLQQRPAPISLLYTKANLRSTKEILENTNKERKTNNKIKERREISGRVRSVRLCETSREIVSDYK